MTSLVLQVYIFLVKIILHKNVANKVNKTSNVRKCKLIHNKILLQDNIFSMVFVMVLKISII